MRTAQPLDRGDAIPLGDVLAIRRAARTEPRASVLCRRFRVTTALLRWALLGTDDGRP